MEKIDKKYIQINSILKKVGYLLSKHDELEIEIIANSSKSRPFNIITVIGLVATLVSFFFLIKGANIVIPVLLGVFGFLFVIYPVIEHIYGGNYKLILSKSRNQIEIEDSFLLNKKKLSLNELKRIEYKGYSSDLNYEIKGKFFIYEIDAILNDGRRFLMISFSGDNNEKMKSYADQCSTVFCDFLNVDRVYTGFNVIMTIELDGKKKQFLK